MPEKQTRQKKGNKQTNARQYGKVYLEDIEALQGASGSDVMVYLCLVYHADCARIAYPSITTIGKETGLSRSSTMRGLRNLKDKYNLIESTGTTATGVTKYKIGSAKSDTRAKPDTRAKSDTTPVPDLKPPPVPDLTPRTEAKLTNSFNIRAAKAAIKGNDEILFLQLWEKWSASPLCLWESNNPLNAYRIARDSILLEWESNNYNKDLEFELTVFDIFLMQAQQEITQGGAYQGPPRLYARGRWLEGLRKWLQSSKPSYINQKRRRFATSAIKVPAKHIEEPTHKEAATNRDEASSEEITLQGETKRAYDTLVEMWKGCNMHWVEWVEVASYHYTNTPFPEHVLNEIKQNRSIQIFDDYLTCN